MNPLKAANPISVTKGAVGLARAAVGVVGAVAREAVHRPVGLTRSAIHLASTTGGPTVVPVEPHAPKEPPVDVVGEAIAAERATEVGEGPGGAGVAHEPRGASRDEEHGDAALRRAEVEEIAQETTAALEGEVEPESHLTEPLIGSAETKAMAAELATMSRAADSNKG